METKKSYLLPKKKLFPGKKILQRSGELERQSTTKKGIHIIKPDSMEVGVTLPYARTMQFGLSKKNIPARPYFTMGKTQPKKWNKIVNDFIFSQAKKAGLRVVRIS